MIGLTMALLVFSLMAYILTWEFTPDRSQAKFIQHQEEYLNNENQEGQLKQDEHQDEQPAKDVDSPVICLPEHLIEKVERIKVNDKWMDVVDVQYLQIESKTHL